jgi:hypothetical protein
MIRSLPPPPSITSARSLPVIVSLPSPPSIVTAVRFGKSAAMTPVRLMALAPGPPFTSIDVIVLHAAAGVGS